MRRKKILFLFLFFTLEVTIVLSQTKPNVNSISDNFWINLPSSPVIIFEDKNPPYSSHIENVSKGSISQYQFGCIKQENGALVIKEEKKNEDFYIGKNISEKFNLFPRSTHGSYLSLICRGDTKLAIIEVRFTDGAKWTIKK